MTITLIGVERLLATFAAKRALSDVALQVGEGELADDVLTQARTLVPVLTGNLRDSLHKETGPGFSRVVTDVVYAGEVEYGGLHNPPEPYMRPAADTVNGERAALAAKAVIDSG